MPNTRKFRKTLPFLCRIDTHGRLQRARPRDVFKRIAKTSSNTRKASRFARPRCLNENCYRIWANALSYKLNAPFHTVPLCLRRSVADKGKRHWQLRSAGPTFQAPRRPWIWSSLNREDYDVLPARLPIGCRIISQHHARTVSSVPE